LDLLETDAVTGRSTGLTKTVRRSVRALEKSGIRYAVIGATALAVRGLPRMTRDLDLVVMIDDAPRAIAALLGAKLRAETPTGTEDDPEPMIVFVDDATGVAVDLLIASGDPEATVVDEAPVAKVFGANGRVATAEHLLLLYLYSNQPKHVGDFAAIVTSPAVDLREAERKVLAMHPEMVAEWRRRVREAQSPPPAPPKPPPRPRRR
jgi:hypothetical protein